MSADSLSLALELIQGFEGCRLRAYRDVVGIWTIGWGETLGVSEGMVWTQQRADAVLRLRVEHFLLAVLARCPALHLEPPGRVAACTSLAYNIGLGAFGASSVCRLTMRQEFVGAADSFLLWNKAGGRVIAGLSRRRSLERKMYLET
ncbi:lysozyme [Massilia sp. MB5]|uniref:lysozyme n=1 Tax=Massilia sp. MB5 TaxID=2919578 RepID=UPI001F0F8FC1|nr:lysozyme [Massilia sp. MB5]UMR33159.1 lysozyme [Massilia sp. MB5]